MKNLKNATISASVWNFGNIVVSQVRTFIVSWILARWFLGPEDFGLIGLSMAFSGLVDSFVDFGLGNAIIQKKDVSQLEKSTVFFVNLLFGCTLTVISYFSAPISAWYFDIPELKSVVQVLSFSFLIKGVSSIHGPLLKKELNYKKHFIIGSISGIVSGILGVFLAYREFGVWSLVYMQITGWVIVVILLWFFSKWRPSFEFNLSSIKELWNFGYKNSLSQFLDSAFVKFDALVIGKLFSAFDLGIYDRGKSLVRLVVRYAFSSFGNVLFPSFSKMNSDYDQIKNSLIKLLNIVCLITFLLTGLLVISAKEMIVFVYTEKWVLSAEIFILLGSFSFVHTIPNVLNSPLLALGKSKEVLKTQVVTRFLYLLAIIPAYFYGINAFVFSSMGASTIGLFLSSYFIKKNLNISILTQTKVFLTYAIPCYSLIVFAVFTKKYIELSNLTSIICYSFYYLICYILLMIVTKNLAIRELKKIVLMLLKKDKV